MAVWQQCPDLCASQSIVSYGAPVLPCAGSIFRPQTDDALPLLPDLTSRVSDIWHCQTRVCDADRHVSHCDTVSGPRVPLAKLLHLRRRPGSRLPRTAQVSKVIEQKTLEPDAQWFYTGSSGTHGFLWPSSYWNRKVHFLMVSTSYYFKFLLLNLLWFLFMWTLSRLWTFSRQYSMTVLDSNHLLTVYEQSYDGLLSFHSTKQSQLRGLGPAYHYLHVFE